MVFLFLQENVNNAQVENADFGLNISKIQKNGTEEKAHPRRVSGTQDPRVEQGVCFSLEKGNHVIFAKHDHGNKSMKG